MTSAGGTAGRHVVLDLPQSGDADVHERPDQFRVELGAGATPDLADRVLEAGPLAIGAVGGHRVQGVGQGEDPGPDVDLLAEESPGVALAVEALLVAEDDRRRGAEEGDALDHLVADVRVALHLRPFLGSEASRLEQHRVGHADLPDVVEERAAADLLQLRAAEPQPLGDGGGVFHHPLAVVGGLVLPGIERRHQGEKGALVGVLNVLQRGTQLAGSIAHLALQLLLVALARQLDPPLGQRPLDSPDEVGELGWLEEVVDCTAAQTVHRRLGVAVAGEHDHRSLRMALAKRLQEPDAVATGHLHVADHQRGCVGRADVQRRFRRAGGAALVTLLL
jgi:hypothetical protein